MPEHEYTGFLQVLLTDEVYKKLLSQYQFFVIPVEGDINKIEVVYREETAKQTEEHRAFVEQVPLSSGRTIVKIHIEIADLFY